MGVFYKYNQFICAFLDAFIRSFLKTLLPQRDVNQIRMCFFLSERGYYLNYAFPFFSLYRPYSHLYPVVCLFSSVV